MKKLSTQKGFTLIELLLVIAIIAIISVFGIASFLSYSRKQTVNTAVLDVASMLNVAKSRSLSQVTKDANNNSYCGSPFVGYAVAICSLGTCVNNTENYDYQLQVVCSSPPAIKITGKKLPANTSFYTGTSPSFLFHALTGAVDVNDVPGNGPIIIDNTFGITPSTTINVCSDGRIKTSGSC